MTRYIIAAAWLSLSLACGTNRECIENVVDIDRADAAAMQRAQLLVQQLTGEHSAELEWRDGRTATVTLGLTKAEPKWVESRRDPDNHNDIAFTCNDRVRVLAAAKLRTSDGLLDESFERVAFDDEDEGKQALNAWFGRAVRSLSGSYLQQQRPGAKPSRLNFAVVLGPQLFRGSVYEVFTGAGASSESAAIGTWDSAPAAP